MTRPAVAIIGGGWAGCVTGRLLHDHGFTACVFEAAEVLGGHCRAETINGVVYEPHGPHIFHTSNRQIADFVIRHGMRRPFAHKVLTEVFLDDADERPHLLSWPPQVDELRQLPIWPRVERELAELPATPSRANLQEYSESIMGRTLYRLFVRDYSVKQWGVPAAELSSAFAPKRLDLRTDGNRRLFRDTWEFYPPNGSQEIIENVARPVAVTTGSPMSAADLPALSDEFDAIVVTAALDNFVGRPGELQWRGIRNVSRYTPLADRAATLTPGYQVNRPSLRRPYTRTVETKHATGQEVNGTVVSEEYPGANAQHYPIHHVDSRNEKRNLALQDEIRQGARVPVFFCGRLATYRYINQDEAIAQAMACTQEVLSCIGERARRTTRSLA